MDDNTYVISALGACSAISIVEIHSDRSNIANTEGLRGVQQLYLRVKFVHGLSEETMATHFIYWHEENQPWARCIQDNDPLIAFIKMSHKLNCLDGESQKYTEYVCMCICMNVCRLSVSIYHTFPKIEQNKNKSEPVQFEPYTAPSS